MTGVVTEKYVSVYVFLHITPEDFTNSEIDVFPKFQQQKTKKKEKRGNLTMTNPVAPSHRRRKVEDVKVLKIVSFGQFRLQIKLGPTDTSRDCRFW